MKRIVVSLVMLLNLIFVTLAGAEVLRVHVEEFKISNDPHPAETKALLRDLIITRLSGGDVLVVDSAAEAAVVVSGRYTVSGTVFSIDAVARDRAGKVLARLFEEGESPSHLIPVLGKLVARLKGAISPSPSVSSLNPSEAAPLPAGAPLNPTSDVIVVQSTRGEGSSHGWLSQRLEGNYRGIAQGRMRASGERELFIITEHHMKFCVQGKDLQTVDEVFFKPDEHLLSVDTADLDGDGIPEVYVTIFNGDSLASQVWAIDGTKLKMTASNLPYYFRSIALNGGKTSLYGQEISNRTDFFGAVRNVVKKGGTYGLQEAGALKLPRSATIYNFNRFSDRTGHQYYVLINDDGHLLVYKESGEEFWRSKEKFGGTELHFKRKDLSDVKFASEPYRWVYLQQRMFVTQDNEIIVPQNSGFWNIGDNRAYSNSRIFGFRWNGSTLEKKWSTKEDENYLGDYHYDPERQELISLEVVKEEGLLDKGASIVSVRRVR